MRRIAITTVALMAICATGASAATVNGPKAPAITAAPTFGVDGLIFTGVAEHDAWAARYLSVVNNGAGIPTIPGMAKAYADAKAFSCSLKKAPKRPKGSLTDAQEDAYDERLDDWRDDNEERLEKCEDALDAIDDAADEASSDAGEAASGNYNDRLEAIDATYEELFAIVQQQYEDEFAAEDDTGQIGQTPQQGTDFSEAIEQLDEDFEEELTATDKGALANYKLVQSGQVRTVQNIGTKSVKACKDQNGGKAATCFLANYTAKRKAINTTKTSQVNKCRKTIKDKAKEAACVKERTDAANARIGDAKADYLARQATFLADAQEEAVSTAYDVYDQYRSQAQANYDKRVYALSRIDRYFSRIVKRRFDEESRFLRSANSDVNKAFSKALKRRSYK